MKAGVVLTGTGPILVITSYPSIDDPNLINKLKGKGISKFIAFEVPIDQCQHIYGAKYHSIPEDLKEAESLEVLDVDGLHIFKNFSLKKAETPFAYENKGSSKCRRCPEFTVFKSKGVILPHR